MSWSEILIVAVVALIVVGPKDLPGMFREFGKFTAKMKRMAREFSSAMEAAADETGAKDIAKDLRTVTSPKNTGLDVLQKATKLDGFDPDSETGKLSKERAEAAEKIRTHSAKVAQDRLDREAAATPASEAAKPQDPAPDKAD